MLIFGTLLTGFAGLLESFSINYWMLVACEFIAAIGTATLFPSAIILGIEWTSKEHRNVVSSLISLSLPIGFALPGLIAAYAHNFRLYLQLLYLPTLISVVLVMLGAESFRWLLAMGKRDRVFKLINAVAKINRCQLSAKSLEIINRKLDAIDVSTAQTENPTKSEDQQTLCKIFKSRVLAMRFGICIVLWMVVSYVGHGVSIISVFLPGDRYFNFVIITLGGLPSSLIGMILLKYVGRRKSMAICLFIVSIANAAGKLLTNEYYYYSLALFFIARCFGMLAFLILYLQASELWPTPLRQTMTGLSSTFGRIGTVLATLTPMLVCMITIIQ